VVVVLAGLFGMHGLGGHGAAEMGTAPPGAMSAMSVDPVSFAPDSMHADRSSPATQLVQEPHDPSGLMSGLRSGLGEGQMDMNMTALCLAVLAVALVALRQVRSRQPDGPMTAARPGRSGARVHSWTDPDPPSLIALSIRRC
jgi:uncharacterized protein DUF6153